MKNNASVKKITHKSKADVGEYKKKELQNLTYCFMYKNSNVSL